jgi:hypothetical protein
MNGRSYCHCILLVELLSLSEIFHHDVSLFVFLDLISFSPKECKNPRIAQRDAHPSKASSQGHSMLSLFSGKGSEIPLPYENGRAMKDALKPNY